MFRIEGAVDVTGAFFQKRPLCSVVSGGKCRGIIPTSLPSLWVWERELGEAVSRAAEPSGGLFIHLSSSECDGLCGCLPVSCRGGVMMAPLTPREVGRRGVVVGRVKRGTYTLNLKGEK